MKIFYLILFLTIIGGAIFITCDIDHGLYPQTYKITGKVIFLRGEPPENTDRLEVFAIKEFPPQDPQNFLYLGQSGKLDYTQGNEIDYEIQVSPTDYDAIALIWKEKGQDISLTGLIGIYTTVDQYPLPVTVSVSKENPIADSIDIYSDWNKVTKDASISGNIIYQGEWPEDTQILLLAVYRDKPEDATSLLFFENIDYTQPVFVDSSSYRLLVSHGKYKYIVLYWVGKNIKDLTDLVELGYYENSNSPGEAGIVDIPASEEAQNIDIHVNFNEIEFP